MTFSGSFPHEGGYIDGDDLRDEAIAIGRPALDALLDVLAHGSTQMRRGALEALFEIIPSAGEMHAMKILARADANLELREAAARLLGGCESVASGKALIAALRVDSTDLERVVSRALVERFDALCTEYLEEKAWAGKLRPLLVEALVLAERLPILRILVDRGYHDDAWALAVRGLLTSEDGYDPERILAEPDIDLEVVRTAAAAVLRERSPADAFTILAPWVTTKGARTEAILWEVDDRLSDYSTGDADALLDPRWESRCQGIGTALADGIARGLAYYRLPSATPRPFLPLSLPDDDDEDPFPAPYPLLVVGFEPGESWKPPEGDWMPTLYHVEHLHLVGFVLRPPAALLEQVVERAFDLDRLEGLPVIRFEPLLRPWDGPRFDTTPWPRLVEQECFSSLHLDELRAADALGPRSGLRLAVLCKRE